MPRSEEAEWWANAVYAAIQEIPAGKVTSYGHIALLLGERMYPLGPTLHEVVADELKNQPNDHAKSVSASSPCPMQIRVPISIPVMFPGSESLTPRA